MAQVLGPLVPETWWVFYDGTNGQEVFDLVYAYSSDRPDLPFNFTDGTHKELSQGTRNAPGANTWVLVRGPAPNNDIQNAYFDTPGMVDMYPGQFMNPELRTT